MAALTTGKPVGLFVLDQFLLSSGAETGLSQQRVKIKHLFAFESTVSKVQLPSPAAGRRSGTGGGPSSRSNWVLRFGAFQCHRTGAWSIHGQLDDALFFGVVSTMTGSLGST